MALGRSSAPTAQLIAEADALAVQVVRVLQAAHQRGASARDAAVTTPPGHSGPRAGGVNHVAREGKGIGVHRHVEKRGG